MDKKFTDTGMQTVIPIMIESPLNKDERIPIHEVSVSPLGAGFGSRNEREPFSGKFDKLLMINLLLTKGCNFRCDYCVEDKDLPDKVMWDYSRFEDLVSWIRKQDVSTGERVTISFFGGEPLLEWETIKEFMHHGLSKHRDIIKFNISTNIVLLDAKKLAWLDENTEDGDITFLLSLDGFENVKSRHAKGNVNDTQMPRIVKHLDGMKDGFASLMKRSSFRVSVLPEYVQYLHQDLIRMVDYSPDGIIIHPVTTDPTAKWTPELYESLTHVINETCRYAIETSNVEIECMEGVSKKDHNCGAGHSMLAMNPNGKYYSCYFTAHAELDIDEMGNFVTEVYNETRANIYKLNPNYDEKCKSCNKSYCFQCSVKNLLHHGSHFCSSAWCEDLADLYTDTLAMCDLTHANRLIAGNAGIRDKDVYRELICKTNDLSKLSMSILTNKPLSGSDDCACGFEVANLSRVDWLQAILDISTVQMSLELQYNQKFPNNQIGSG